MCELPREPAEWPEGLLGSVLPGPPQKDPLQSSLLTFRTAGQFGEHFIKSHSGGLAVMVATVGHLLLDGPRATSLPQTPSRTLSAPLQSGSESPHLTVGTLRQVKDGCKRFPPPPCWWARDRCDQGRVAQVTWRPHHS